MSVEHYPDIEALQNFEEFLLEQNWPRYIESKLYLGTPLEAEPLLKNVCDAPDLANLNV